jgi:hypothetical protein
MAFGRLQGLVFGRFALYPSTVSYIAWALLYALLLAFGWLGAEPPRLFTDILFADFIINLVSPFIIGGGSIVFALAAGALANRGKRFPPGAYPIMLAALVFGIVVPAAVMLHVGGWWILPGAALFFSRVNWMFMANKDGRTAMLMIRGVVGPLAFFAPALVLSCLYVGRNTLGLENTDWVPFFGTVYFGLQAGFEEFMWRQAEKKQ